ncbi:predicted protein [Sclerotinia sclerotiorum 1980 UF-70]|uniref:Uncharacterized protein n=1 Tax=Sclerotinia sclerotiorum (strain ATCC 18683 / 1980 / Ss-1) TaxID=665079 RepID=A7ESI6_SCLS1|nr:predicted protein [Sclerotinia sclerotiorum 1980 UF-70]EDN92428.1 predicted protein [Sclerotinia sclerotiorum 1980 UF-70]
MTDCGNEALSKRSCCLASRSYPQIKRTAMQDPRALPQFKSQIRKATTRYA